MTELPGTPWQTAPWTEAAWTAHAPMPADWRRAGDVHHVFTHFELRLEVYAASVPAIVAADGYPRPLAALAGEALPSVMRKCAATVLSAGADSAPRQGRAVRTPTPRPSPVPAPRHPRRDR